MKTDSQLLAAILVVSLCLIIFVFRWVHRRRKILRVFKDHGIPGPETNFFTGNLHQLKDAPIPNDVITKWLKQFGNIFGYFIGESPYLVVNDINLLKQVMITDFSNFSSRPPFLLDVKPLIDSIICLEGQRWKEVRRILSPSFSSTKIRSMTSIMDRKTSTMLRVVKEKAIANEMFDMYDVVQALTLDVIADCALAMKVNCLENPKDPFLLAVRNFIRESKTKLVECVVFFPFIASILTFLFVFKFLISGQLTAMIVNNVKEVIGQRKENTRRNDILQLMLDAAESREGLSDDPSVKKKNLLTDDEIIANAYVLLLAGYETTATSLAFTFHLLVQHPEVQEKLYEEIASNKINDDWSYEAVQSLHYLDQVFNESLRLYPPLSLFVNRKCVKECKLGDMLVPKGVILQAPVWDIHHDPKFWPDPWKFDPGRFAPENENNFNKMAFLPFGVGPRNCLGMRFAQLEAKLAIAKLVQKFRFVSCEKTEHPLKLSCPTAMVINPANGVYLQAVVRHSDS